MGSYVRRRSRRNTTGIGTGTDTGTDTGPSVSSDLESVNGVIEPDSSVGNETGTGASDRRSDTAGASRTRTGTGTGTGTNTRPRKLTGTGAGARETEKPAPRVAVSKSKREKAQEEGEEDFTNLIVDTSINLADTTGIQQLAISEREALRVARPGSRIMARHPKWQETVRVVADPLALITASLIVFGPRLVILAQWGVAQVNAIRNPNLRPRQSSSRSVPPGAPDFRPDVVSVSRDGTAQFAESENGHTTATEQSVNIDDTLISLRSMVSDS